MKSIIRFSIYCGIALCFLTSCSDEEIQPNYIYQPPENLNDGLEVSSLDDEGLDPYPIRVMMDSIDAGAYGIFHSLLIFKSDKLVFEEYLNGTAQNDLQPMYSATKSIASAMIGIAIEQGYISGTGATIHDLLTPFTQLNWTTETEQITLENCLTMSTGYQWNETAPYDDPANSHYQMINSDDWIKYLIELPVVRTPGTTFHYNTGTSTLFSVFVTEASGVNFDDYTYDNLLSKIGVEDYYWYYMPGNYPATGGSYGGIFLTSREMAKFGLLYLNNGLWGNERIISQDWIDRSISPQINITDSGSFTYGYQWWRFEYGKGKNGEVISVPYAVGHGGQYIFLYPDYDMLVVITSPFETSDRTTVEVLDMVSDYILSAIR